MSGLQEHKDQARQYIETLRKEQFTIPRWQGRGIVTAVHPPLLPSFYVLVRSLRGHLRCDLPIECFHIGEADLPSEWRAIFEPLGVVFIDAEEVQRRDPRAHITKFAIKTFAIYHSSFDEILWLDADSVPTWNLNKIFGFKEFERDGLVLWPDYPDRWTVSAEGWDAFDLPIPPIKELAFPGGESRWMDRQHVYIDDAHLAVVPIETGQQLIHKSRHIKPLLLSMHYCNDHYNWYTRWQYGDKECLSMACRRLGVPFAVPRWYPSHNGHTCTQYDFDGVECFNHRNAPEYKWRIGYNAASKSVKAHYVYFRYTGDLTHERIHESPWRVNRERMTSMAGSYFFDADIGPYFHAHLYADGEVMSKFKHTNQWELWESVDDGSQKLVMQADHGTSAEMTWSPRLSRWEGTFFWPDGGQTTCMMKSCTIPIVRPSSKAPFVVGIPTLRKYDRLDRCIEAVLNSSLPPQKVIVVDNGNGYAGAYAAHPMVDIERPGMNLGVAASWNLIHRLSGGQDIVLLNDDLVVGHTTLHQLLSVPEAVVCACNWSCFLQRARVWDKVGDYDEQFWPAYFEDTDYRHRLDHAGIAVAHIHDRDLVHEYQGSGGVDPATWQRLHNRYMTKWYKGRQQRVG